MKALVYLQFTNYQVHAKEYGKYELLDCYKRIHARLPSTLGSAIL